MNPTPLSATKTVTTESVLLDHAFALPTTVGIVAVCCIALAVSLYSERHVLGIRSAIGFATLRITAIATALWMLLAPTSVVEKSTTTRKAVALLADTSASMTTVDPPGTSDDRRWQNPSAIVEDLDALNSSDADLVTADRGVAAMGIAEQQLSLAVASVDSHGSQSAVVSHVDAANTAIQRATDHLESLRSSTPAADQALLARLTELLASPEYASLDELASSLRKGRTPADSSWREGLADLVGRTVTVRRVFQELSLQLALQPDAAATKADISQQLFANLSRGERVSRLLQEFNTDVLADISKRADVRWTAFGDTARPVDSGSDVLRQLNQMTEREQQEEQTDLAAGLSAVERMREQQPVAATFIFSDVAHNRPDAASPLEVASRMDGSPVYVVPIGNPERRRDIDLVAVSAPSVAMRNDNVVIEAQLEAYQCLGEGCVVQLLADGEVIDFRNVDFDSDSASRSVRFDQRVSEVGPARFQLAVQPLDGEMTTENNFGEVEINVTRSDIKVLLADELPRWEYRYLAQLFRRDPKVEVDELLFNPRVIATGNREESKAFPATADDWNYYDVVILGDISPDRFPQVSQQALVEYVRKRGGTVMMIAGSTSMPQQFADAPLSTLVPVQPTSNPDETEYAFRVTEAGQSHIALMIAETASATRDSWDFINRFSPLHTVSQWRQPLPSATSLIAAVPKNADEDFDDTRSTFLCWQSVGRGRAVYLAGPDTYRLRFLRGDHLHYRFWGQLMRWAIASDLSTGNQYVRIRTLKSVFESDEPVHIDVELFDAEGGPLAEAVSDDLAVQLTFGDTQRLVPLTADADRPGQYHAIVEGLPAGVYTAEPVGQTVENLLTDSAEPVTATLTVQTDLPTELVDTRSDRTLAAQIASLTGGQILPPTAISEVLKLTDLEPIVTLSIQREPLWLRWHYLWLVFGCLQFEWIVRKWRGLS